ncbi:MAG TPA: methyltransferase domain-containing protein [Candidatus Kryptonia bacterium]
MSRRAKYVHGTNREEQTRLAKLNDITNKPYIEFLGLKGNESVLEVGSGLGILTSSVAGLLKHGKIIGLEYSWEQLSRVPRPPRNLQFVRADAQGLPFENNSFDIVYSRYVLEHLGDPLGALKEMRRVVGRNGKVFAMENNIAMNLFYPKCPVYEKLWNDLGTLQEMLGGDAYIGKKLMVLFRDAGFRKIELSIQPEVHYSHSPAFELWVENTLSVLQGAKQGIVEHGVASALEFDLVAVELREFKKRKDASTVFYWNRAVGTK